MTESGSIWDVRAIPRPSVAGSLNQFRTVVILKTAAGERHGRDAKNRGDSGGHVVGYSRLARADEDRTLARLRTLRSDLIDPTIAVHHGRVVKRTGDGALVEFRSVVEAVRCAIEVQNSMAERNAGLPPINASIFASAFISAMWSRRAMAISWATE